MGLFELLILIGIVAVVFGAVIAAMAVGVIFSNRRIQGSCGGLSTMRGDSPCMACGGSPKNCDEATQAACDDAACDEATRAEEPRDAAASR
jgi:hypothetical protein